MKLLLSVFAENLPGTEDGTTKLDPFVIITALPPPPSDDNISSSKSTTTKPTIIGQTETLLNVGKASSIRWTKKIVLPDSFELGQVIHLVVTVYNGRNATNEKLPIGSCLFEVNSVLGCKNSTIAKQMKRNLPNALLGLQIIEQQQQQASSTTTADGEQKGSSSLPNNMIFHYQLSGTNLTSKDGLGFGIYNKSDPFYELQRLRYNSKNRKQAIWDTVYRSCLIDNNNNPTWPEVYIDLKELLSDVTNYNELIRIVIYDKDDNGAKELIGSIKLSITDFLNHNQSGYTIYDEKGKSGGTLKILKASIDKLDDDNSSTTITTETKKNEHEPKIEQLQSSMEELEIVDSIPEEDIEYTTGETDRSTTNNNKIPTFLDYVKAGCELRVIIGIDTTASNGNPRQPTSLHYFEPDIQHKKNDYEQAMYSICSILEKYDSDQKFPIYGFGSKINDQISHCFPFVTPNDNDNDEADGVDGILHLYRTIFRSGLVMSSPRNYAALIRQAGSDAKTNYERGQSYSILLLFTNGSAADQDVTIEALKKVDDTPLSIVIIGVGENGDFTGAKELQDLSQNTANNANGGQRDKVRFVHYTNELKKHEGGTKTLSTAALDDVPHQLVAYFTSRGIQPLQKTKSSSSSNSNDGDEEYEEIVVEPYTPETDIIVPMEINSSTGEATVTDTVQIPPRPSSSGGSSSSKRNQGKQTIKQVTKFGKDVQGVIVRSHQYRAIKQKVRSLF